MDEEKPNVEKKSVKTLILKSLFLLVNLVVIIILYYLLTIFVGNLLFIFLIIFLAVLVIIGPFFKRRKSSYYSRLFPNKKNTEKNQYEKLIKQKERERLQAAHTKPIPDIDLSFKYKKPSVRKCNKCGMVLPSFVKKCPVCGTPISE